MYFLEDGNPQNPAIVFLHGLPLSSKMWRPQIEELKNKYYCIAPDLPGHGESASIDFESADVTAEQIAEFVVEKVPSKCVNLLGLSFGGVIAQALMVNRPDVINKVILSGTSTRLSSLMIWLQNLNAPILKLLKPQQVAKLVAAQFSLPQKFIEEFADDFQNFSVESFNRMMEAYGKIPSLANIKNPLLVVAGEKETFVAKRMAQDLANSSPHAIGGIVDKAGHVWNLQFPQLFSEMIDSFITEKPLPPEIKLFDK